jgi:lambda family phage portal protein
MEVLDPRYSDAEKNIHMSIQFDEWGAPVGYYLQIPDPRSFGLGFKSREKERVDADNIRHLFYSRRFSQSHGYSGFAPIMTPLRHLSKYEEAEVIAARASANKIGFFETTEAEGYTGDEDGSGNIKAPSGPGEWEQLPMGVKPHLIDPSHPNANYPDFRKAMLRKACAGLVANYNVIGRDLEGVSFSSIRQGVLSERDAYRILHAFMIQEHELPTFERWLRMALLAGKIDGLDIRDYDRLKHVEFSGRTWPWVDPVKDIQAAREEIDLGINSRQSISREKGRDFAKMVSQNEEDVAMLEAAGLLAGSGASEGAGSSGDADRNAIEFETLKSKFDAYGVAVRAGCITPQTVDEESFRAEAGLPDMSKEAIQAWVDDKGIRRPITLQSQAAFEATQDATAKSATEDSAPVSTDEDYDE